MRRPVAAAACAGSQARHEPPHISLLYTLHCRLRNMPLWRLWEVGHEEPEMVEPIGSNSIQEGANSYDLPG
jgi:hypothetical protein